MGTRAAVRPKGRLAVGVADFWRRRAAMQAGDARHATEEGAGAAWAARQIGAGECRKRSRDAAAAEKEGGKNCRWKRARQQGVGTESVVVSCVPCFRVRGDPDDEEEAWPVPMVVADAPTCPPAVRCLCGVVVTHPAAVVAHLQRVHRVPRYIAVSAATKAFAQSQTTNDTASSLPLPPLPR